MPDIRPIPGANSICNASQKSNGATPSPKNGIKPDQKFDPLVLVQSIRSHPRLSSETKDRLELLVRATAYKLASESLSPHEPVMVTLRALQESARHHTDQIWATGDVDLKSADSEWINIYQNTNFDECDLHWLMQIMS